MGEGDAALLVDEDMEDIEYGVKSKADDGVGEGSGGGERKGGHGSGEGKATRAKTSGEEINDKPNRADGSLPPPAPPSSENDAPVKKRGRPRKVVSAPAGKKGGKGQSAPTKPDDSPLPPPAPAPAPAAPHTTSLDGENVDQSRKRKTPDTGSSKAPAHKKPKKTAEPAPVARSRTVKSPSPPLLKGRMLGKYFYAQVRSPLRGPLTILADSLQGAQLPLGVTWEDEYEVVERRGALVCHCHEYFANLDL
jgi:hypothetical protein